jgi:hypothetical protein
MTTYSNCWLGDRVQYKLLSGKEQESYNAAHLKQLMATYGYLEAFTINGDKHGADLLFYRSSDSHVLKVQLKGRATINKLYAGKELYIAFNDKSTGIWYVYPHDEVMAEVLTLGKCSGTTSWEDKGSWSWPGLPVWLKNTLKNWIIPESPNSPEPLPMPESACRYSYTPGWEMT